jgi:hypothetical protein
MTKDYGTEYRVVEHAEEGDFWYPHGYTGFSRRKAVSALEHFETYYGIYGRTFRIEARQVSKWESIP